MSDDINAKFICELYRLRLWLGPRYNVILIAIIIVKIIGFWLNNLMAGRIVSRLLLNDFITGRYMKAVGPECVFVKLKWAHVNWCVVMSRDSGVPSHSAAIQNYP